MSTDLTDLRTELTRTLTAIARESLQGKGFDVAEVIANSAAAAAANVGGPEALLSGRPGSWEAAALRQLLTGAMGDDPDYWDTLRTEPVTIRLNVAQLIESGDWHPGLVGLDDALARLCDAYDDRPDTDETADEMADQYSDEADALIARYESGYIAYAERFTAAVSAVATDLQLSHRPHGDRRRGSDIVVVAGRCRAQLAAVGRLARRRDLGTRPRGCPPPRCDHRRARGGSDMSRRAPVVQLVDPESTSTLRSSRSTDDKLTLAELCAELQISRSTFYDWRAKGRAPRCLRLPNGDLRIRREDLERWLESLADCSQ